MVQLGLDLQKILPKKSGTLPVLFMLDPPPMLPPLRKIMRLGTCPVLGPINQSLTSLHVGRVKRKNVARRKRMSNPASADRTSTKSFFSFTSRWCSTQIAPAFPKRLQKWNCFFNLMRGIHAAFLKKNQLCFLAGKNMSGGGYKIKLYHVAQFFTTPPRPCSSSRGSGTKRLLSVNTTRPKMSCFRVLLFPPKPTA